MTTEEEVELDLEFLLLCTAGVIVALIVVGAHVVRVDTYVSKDVACGAAKTSTLEMQEECHKGISPVLRHGELHFPMPKAPFKCGQPDHKTCALLYRCAGPKRLRCDVPQPRKS